MLHKVQRYKIIQIMIENSSTKPTNATRRLIDVSPFNEQLENGAIADSALVGELYNVTEYVRDIIRGYFELKEKHPEVTPKNLSDIIK